MGHTVHPDRDTLSSGKRGHRARMRKEQENREKTQRHGAREHDQKIRVPIRQHDAFSLEL